MPQYQDTDLEDCDGPQNQDTDLEDCDGAVSEHDDTEAADERVGRARFARGPAHRTVRLGAAQLDEADYLSADGAGGGSHADTETWCWVAGNTLAHPYNMDPGLIRSPGYSESRL